jgi:large subunit ribosomal protein L4
MSKLQVYNMSGAAEGEMELPDDLLELKKGSQAVHDVVVAMLAGRRSGNASTLTKGEVAGSNKKPWRQKGTGRARAGLRQSPVWRGGGVAFGPHPRSYEQKVNRKVARLAFRRAFSEKVAGNQVRVIEELVVAEPKTKVFRALMKALNVDRPTLFVVDKVERNAVLACRNIPGVEMVAAADVNTYQLLRHPVVVVTKAGLDRIRTRLGGNGEGAA